MATTKTWDDASDWTPSNTSAIPDADSLVLQSGLDANLKGYWPLDSESSGVWADSTDNGNDLTEDDGDGSMSGPYAVAVTGKVSNGAQLLASDFDMEHSPTWLVVDSPATDFHRAGDFSFGFIVKPLVAPGSGAKYARHENNGGWDCFVGFNGERSPVFRVWHSLGSVSVDGDSSVDFTDGDWHHVICVCDATGEELRVYCDGVKASTAFAYTPKVPDSDTYFRIGEWGYCVLDEVFFYHGALTDANVATLYNSGDMDGASTLFSAYPSSQPEVVLTTITEPGTVDMSSLSVTATGAWEYAYNVDDGGWSSWLTLAGFQAEDDQTYSTSFAVKVRPPNDGPATIDDISLDYTTNTVPVTPTNLSPNDLASCVSINPTLQSNDFSDSDDDSHDATDWRIGAGESGGNITGQIWTSASDSVNLVSIVVDDDPGTFEGALAGQTSLAIGTTYYWQVRYSDGTDWSSWSTPTSFTTNRAPAKPTNSSPDNAATGISLTRELIATIYSDLDGDDHQATDWRLGAASDGTTVSSIVWSSLSDTVNLERVTISPALPAETVCYWQVRYQDDVGNWSDWSTPTSFTTSAPPNKPTNVSPSDAETDVNVATPLQSSAFDDNDIGEAHNSTDWRVGTTSDGSTVSDIVWSSLADETNLVSVTASDLSGDTTYYWQVRYKDAASNWSSWSTPTSFTTIAGGGGKRFDRAVNRIGSDRISGGFVTRV